MFQEVLQNNDFVVSTIFCGVLIAVIMYAYTHIWHWRQHHRTAELNEALYDDMSKCVSPSCVRCQNYGQLTADLLGRFLDFRDAQPSARQEPLRRLQTAVEATCGLLDPDAGPPAAGGVELQRPSVFSLRGLPAAPWQDGRLAPEVAILEEALPAIKREYRELLIEQNSSENFDGWLENSVPSGVWSVFHLVNQGARVEENCARCPRTVAVLGRLRSFMKGCAFGNASFSVLEAGTHITEHYGPSNVRIRCHLGLHVPSQCSLTVAHESRRWQEGSCLLFDDSFLHEARHAGGDNDGPRVVLLLDFWHPDVTDVEREALCHLFSLK